MKICPCNKHVMVYSELIYLLFNCSSFTEAKKFSKEIKFYCLDLPNVRNLKYDVVNMCLVHSSHKGVTMNINCGIYNMKISPTAETKALDTGLILSKQNGGINNCCLH